MYNETVVDSKLFPSFLWLYMYLTKQPAWHCCALSGTCQCYSDYNITLFPSTVAHAQTICDCIQTFTKPLRYSVISADRTK